MLPVLLELEADFLLGVEDERRVGSLTSSMLSRVVSSVAVAMTVAMRSRGATLSNKVSSSSNLTINSSDTLSMVTLWSPMVTPSWVWKHPRFAS